MLDSLTVTTVLAAIIVPALMPWALQLIYVSIRYIYEKFKNIEKKIYGFLRFLLVILIFFVSISFLTLIPSMFPISLYGVEFNKTDYIFRLITFFTLNFLAIYLYSRGKNLTDKHVSYDVSYYLHILLASMIIAVVWFFFEYLFNNYYSFIGSDISNLFKYANIADDKSQSTTTVPLDAGQIGDYFGGILNPIVGFSSLIILSLTLIIVHKSMNNAKESADLFKEQLLTQRFEDTFFSMFNVLNDLKKDILKSESLVINNDKNDIFYGVSTQKSKSEVDEAILLILQHKKESRKNLLDNYHNINAFFRLLYRILTHISEPNNKKIISDFDEKKYVGIVRSIITNDLYHLLLLNCMVDRNDRNFLEYKEMLIKYSFFEHLSFLTEQRYLFSNGSYQLFLRNINRYYQDQNYKAFGDNSEVINRIKKVGSNNPTLPSGVTT